MPNDPVFLEVKRKTNTIVYKRRAALSREDTRTWMGTGTPPINGESHADASYFRTHQSMIGARPVIRVHYWREAYESNTGEPVRVTSAAGRQDDLEYDENGNLITAAIYTIHRQRIDFVIKLSDGSDGVHAVNNQG